MDGRRLDRYTTILLLGDDQYELRPRITVRRQHVVCAMKLPHHTELLFLA